MKSNLKVAIRAALEAGNEILKVYKTEFDIETKADQSPLTQADRNANTVINKWLLATQIPIISEENRQLPYAQRKDWPRCWIVDPLDGTKEFIKRNGEFTVNIALVEEGQPVMGVIYVPVSKMLYFTSENGNTSKKLVVASEEMEIEDILGQALTLEPLQFPSGSTLAENTVKVVGSRSHLNEDTLDYISELKINHQVEIVSKGSSLKFCLLAEGRAHIYPRFGPTMEWDTAAGDAICRAVGVSVIDQTTQKPLRYNKTNLLNNYFVAQVE